MGNCFIVFALLLFYIPKAALFNLSIVQGKPVAERFIMAVFGPRGLSFPCHHLRSAPQQQKSCLRNQEIPILLQKAAEVAKNNCQEQFRFNPWDCSSLFANINFVKGARMYRETALLYAMYNAALVQTVSRACANGRLKRCSCPGIHGSNVQSAWNWRACRDDFIYGCRFTRRFLQLSRVGMDPLGVLVRHNSEVGMQTVGEKINNICKCHGISGSCTMRTCWQKLPNFKNVAQQLKQLYHSAEIKIPHNNIRSKKLPSMSTKQLLYLENSPSFCSVTHGRQCENPPNCATLCCGRGYIQNKKPIQYYCNCRWKSNVYVLKCDICSSMHDIFICK